MEGYTVRIPDELRMALDEYAIKEPRVSAADMARRWMEIGHAVYKAGFSTLAEFCSGERVETLDNWTKNDD